MAETWHYVVAGVAITAIAGCIIAIYYTRAKLEESYENHGTSPLTVPGYEGSLGSVMSDIGVLSASEPCP